MLKVLDLFSGIGGFTRGFEMAGGFETVGFVEIDPFCQKVLKKHWPDVPIFSDIRTFRGDEVGTIDVVVGGFPCQDLSVAGKRAGLAGERSGLFFEFVRIADELATETLVIENVPSLLSSHKGKDFAILLEHVTGYRPSIPKDGWRNSGICCGPKRAAAWRVLDAQYLGLAQRRKRVFIVADTRGWTYPAAILFEPESCIGDTPPSREKGQGVARCTPTRTRIDSDTETFIVKGAAIGRKPENGPQWGEVLEDGTCYTLNTAEVHAVTYGIRSAQTGANGWGIQENVTHTLDGASPHMVCGPLKERSYKGVNAEEAADGQLVVAATLRSGGDGGIPSSRGEHLVCGFQGSDPSHAIRSNPSKADKPDSSSYVIAPTPSTKNEVASSSTQREKWYEQAAQMFGAVRRLTPTECERLQGFPDNWTLLDAKTPDSHRYKALGNAVAVPVIRWLAHRIKEAS